MYIPTPASPLFLARSLSLSLPPPPPPPPLSTSTLHPPRRLFLASSSVSRLPTPPPPLFPPGHFLLLTYLHTRFTTVRHTLASCTYTVAFDSASTYPVPLLQLLHVFWKYPSPNNSVPKGHSLASCTRSCAVPRGTTTASEPTQHIPYPPLLAFDLASLLFSLDPSSPLPLRAPHALSRTHLNTIHPSTSRSLHHHGVASSHGPRRPSRRLHTKLHRPMARQGREY